MQQQGGPPSQYGPPPPEMVPQFSSAGGGLRLPRVLVGIHGGAEHPQNQPVAEAASPISSRSAPQPMVVASRSPAPTLFDELGGGGAAASARGLVDEEGIGVGEDGERGGGVGSRWPRQETIALLKIRSEMDSVFRDATLKGPLWEDVSRKLAELGYKRNAKKCKEKFENVHKYYKRTKENRAGRQDGKSYRFFTQLEALHSPTTTAAAAAAAAVPSFSPATNINPFPPLISDPSIDTKQPPPTTAHAGISFSSDTSPSSSSNSDTGELPDGGRKRKRQGWPHGNGKTIAFFEKLMKQLIERQEAMQQRFLDTIEKREQDRTAREEAWKRQEMARLNREYELMVQERTITANRDAAVISFLQKFAGAAAGVTNQQNAPPEISQEDQPEEQRSHQVNEIVMAPMSSPKSNSPASRWPKTEVLELIKLRSGLELRYMETGPKGPFWEDISMGMRRMGYNRSPKRCKEKWENINKYFKKVKEGNKKRPEDAKTCPYFHELDALYRRKRQQEIGTNTGQPVSVSVEQERNYGGNQDLITVRNNAKPEDIVKELMERQNQEEEEDDVDDDEYDDEDEEEEGKVRYEIQFQRQSVGDVGNGGNDLRKTPASVTPSSNAASFLAMVQ